MIRWCLHALMFFSSTQLWAECRADISLVSGLGWANFNVEVAATPEEREKGLMFREHLGAYEGMLFLYQDLDYRTYWMKNTPISLDILFFNKNRRLINIHKRTKPFSEEYLPSQGVSPIVLEIRGGIFDILDIHADSTTLHIKNLKGDCPNWVIEQYQTL